jgi:3'(2'), 5'-bisphosphate nucleotidase
MTYGSLTIRPAAWRDRVAILRLVAEMGGHDEVPAHEDPMRYLAALLAGSDARVLVAEWEQRIVGFAEVQARSSSIGDRREAWLGGLAVDPSLRGSGVGRRLLGAVECEARMLGCSAIVLESSTWRERSHSFYRRAGYEEKSDAKRFVRPVPPLAPDATLIDRFLVASAEAITAVRNAIAGLHDAPALGVGADGAPTEAADRAAEDAALEALVPLGIPIVSEECGIVGRPEPDAPWISLDPLDGSRNYRCCYAPYATAIGLVRHGRPLAGFVGEHVSGRRWWASLDGAFSDGGMIWTRPGPLVGYPSPDGVPIAPPPDFARVRISGSTATDLCRVADGALAAFCALDRSVVHMHDLAGPLAILDRAGAAVLDEQGMTPRLVPDPTVTVRIVAAANHEIAQGLLARR